MLMRPTKATMQVLITRCGIYLMPHRFNVRSSTLFHVTVRLILKRAPINILIWILSYRHRQITLALIDLTPQSWMKGLNQ